MRQASANPLPRLGSVARENNLIEEIKRNALDDQVPLANALRQCIVLGGEAGSEKLRDWATRELKGYYGEDVPELPDYRVIAAPLVIDGVAGLGQISHQQISPLTLPDFAREQITEKLELRDGVGALEALAKKDEIRLSPPLAADLVVYMNANDDRPGQHITALYWMVSPAAVHGVIDQIRTALTQLVAELRANMPSGEQVPSTEAADQAVNVIVTGKRSQVTVTAAQSNGEGDATATTTTAPDESGFWTRWRKIGAFIVGSATVVAAVVAITQIH